jgi:hypothetical protein
MPAWRVLKAQLQSGHLPSKAADFRLSLLIRYCSARQIAPDQVDAATFDQFRSALETESFVKSPREVYRDTCLYWNRVRTYIRDWPKLTIAVPSASRRYSLDWSDFPATLQLDVEAYLSWTGNHDPFDDDYARPLRPSVIALHRGQLRRIATALVRSGCAPETITDRSSATTSLRVSSVVVPE